MTTVSNKVWVIFPYLCILSSINVLLNFVTTAYGEYFGMIDLICFGLFDADLSTVAAYFGDRGAHRQIWGPNVNIIIYILTHEYSFWIATRFRDCQIGGTGSGNSAILAPNSSDQENRAKTPLSETKAAVSFLMPQGALYMK